MVAFQKYHPVGRRSRPKRNVSRTAPFHRAVELTQFVSLPSLRNRLSPTREVKHGDGGRRAGENCGVGQVLNRCAQTEALETELHTILNALHEQHTHQTLEREDEGRVQEQPSVTRDCGEETFTKRG